MTSHASTVTFADPAVVRSAGEVVLYGAGQVGLEVLRLLTLRGVSVKCFLDRAAREGQVVEGVPVQNADTCDLDLTQRSRTPVVLSVFNRDVNPQDLANVAIRAGFRDVVSFIDLHAAFPELRDRFWLTSRTFWSENRAAIDAIEGLWADDKSRRIYADLIRLRRTGVASSALTPEPKDRQYLPPDVPAWRGQRAVRFVDCGAFDGDTMASLLTSGVSFESVACFEPDLANFVALAHFVRRAQPAATALLWPCAVGSSTTFQSFSGGNGEASAITASGTSTVPMVALDDVLVGWQPTLIKMDVEGAEADAVRGARRLIAASRPSLALCLYHRPPDLWEIPALLASWPELQGYRHFLRIHGHNGFDTVMYSVPPERQGE